MAYTYSTYLSIKNSEGRFTNFTATPTVTVLDGLAAAVIASPAPTLTNLDAVGHYRAAITIATLTDVIFAIAPAAADQAAIADISTLHTKVEQVIEENIDAATTSRLASDDPRLDNLDAPVSGTSTLTQADILADATPFPGAFIDMAISDVAGGVVVTATVAISATDAMNVASGLLALRSYNTFEQSVTSTSTDDLSSATSIWLAIKRSVRDVDGSSLIFVEETAGLTVLGGEEYSVVTDGTLTVTGSSGDWTITARVEADAMAEIGSLVGQYSAEIKYKIGTDVRILWSGAAILTDGVVQAI
jgi:hypothetical protein